MFISFGRTNFSFFLPLLSLFFFQERKGTGRGGGTTGVHISNRHHIIDESEPFFLLQSPEKCINYSFILRILFPLTFSPKKNYPSAPRPSLKCNVMSKENSFHLGPPPQLPSFLPVSRSPFLCLSSQMLQKSHCIVLHSPKYLAKQIEVW